MNEKILDVRTHAYPLLGGGAVSVVMVLVNGYVGDYAAYEAAIPGAPALTPDHLGWVAAYGNKMRYEAAETHFDVTRSKYRI